MTNPLGTRIQRFFALAFIAALVATSMGCDQDGNGHPTDVAVEDSTAGDTLPDTDPGDTPPDTDPGDTITPDPGDAPTDGDDEPPPTLPTPGTYTESMTVDGITRTYVVNIPETAVAAMGSGRVPFLIALHGAGDTGGNFITATGLTALAASNAFVVIGPDGYRRGWFVSSGEGWPGTDGHSSSLENDVAYMLQLIDHGYDNWGIDRNAVYAVGHSRGAGMTAMLAIGSGRITTVAGLYVSPFAAYCVNAGYDPYAGSMGYSTDPKRPVWVIHGSADSVVPFSAGEDLSNGLTAAGWDVTWTPVTGGSHTWLFQSSLGQTNQDLWDFFASHPLP